MPFNLVIIHLLLAILLFFIANWIGHHSLSMGYLQLSLFSKSDEAPAFNFLFRVLTPVVFLVIVSAVLYSIEQAWIVRDIYFVALYYILVRSLFNLITERAKLIDWKTQFVIALSTVGLSYAAYTSIIRYRANLLPNFETIANELWIIVALFLYSAANRVNLSTVGMVRRKNRYLDDRYRQFSRRFGSIIEAKVPDDDFAALVYAVMIYESFNRPALYRMAERRLLYPLGLSRSFGVMQVQADYPLTDEESVELGTAQLLRRFNRIVQNIEAIPDQDWFGGDAREIGSHARAFVEQRVLGGYNIRSDYALEVLKVKEIIIARFYPELAPKDPYAFLDESDSVVGTVAAHG